MYKPPFHRQILPWLYVITFLAVAPVLIFYTAGYRYNSKKGQIERNGTLIVDTFPTGAHVWIDGADTGEKTPITFQNIVPGWHHVRIFRDGRYVWQKTLEIRSEQVTFANQIWLWQQTEPTLVLSAPVRAISTDPLRSHAALLEQRASSTELLIWAPGSPPTLKKTVPNVPAETPISLRWNDDGSAILIGGLHASDAAWSTEAGADVPVDQLPSGFYHWSGNQLIGIHENTLYEQDLKRHAFTRQVLDPNVLSVDNGLSVRLSTSTNQVVLEDHSFLSRIFALPNGHWQIGDVHKPQVLLTDGARWLDINLNQSNPFANQIDGDFPRWLPNAAVPRALFVNLQKEVWSWTQGDRPILLWRQSDPVVQAVWHRSGSTVFIATPTQIVAQDLDDRNGRVVTPLATFDHIYDAAIIGRVLYVAATRGGQEGVWQLVIE